MIMCVVLCVTVDIQLHCLAIIDKDLWQVMFQVLENSVDMTKEERSCVFYAIIVNFT